MLNASFAVYISPKFIKKELNNNLIPNIDKKIKKYNIK